jgi:SAM-dependent methyltransferase
MSRDARLDLALDVLKAGLPSGFDCLDLGAGPGTLARRILERFPKARVTCVDNEAAFTRVGTIALCRYGTRLRYECADLRHPGWDRFLGDCRVDAVVSSLALHTLRRNEVRSLYADLSNRIRRGGILVNADSFPWSRSEAHLNSLSNEVREMRSARGSRISRKVFAQGYEAWWSRARKLGLLGDYAPGGKEPPLPTVTAETHLELLTAAGFRHPTVIWQDLNTRIIVAAS